MTKGGYVKTKRLEKTKSQSLARFAFIIKDKSKRRNRVKKDRKKRIPRNTC